MHDCLVKLCIKFTIILPFSNDSEQDSHFGFIASIVPAASVTIEEVESITSIGEVEGVLTSRLLEAFISLTLTLLLFLMHTSQLYSRISLFSL